MSNVVPVAGATAAVSGWSFVPGIGPFVVSGTSVPFGPEATAG